MAESDAGNAGSDGLAGGRLAELLGLSGAGPSTSGLRKQAALRVEGVEAPDARMVAAALRQLAPEELDRQLARMFEVNLFALCADAWAQLRRVREGVQRSRAEPGKLHLVDLPGHQLEARLKPSLVVTLGGVDWCHVGFELLARFRIGAVTLELRDGQLTGLRFMDSEAVLTLSCEGHELQDFKRRLQLLPEVRLREPIPLGAARP